MAETQMTVATPMDEFNKRLSDRLRADIGDLLPDDVLAGLVHRVIEEQFFKGRKVSVDSWGRTEDKPSLFVEQVVKAVQPKLTEQIDAYLTAHSELFDTLVQKFVEDHVLEILTAERLANRLDSTLNMFLSQLANRPR